MAEKYNEKEQEIYLTFLFSSEEAFARCRNILKPYYFDKKFQAAMKFIIKYADEYKALPTEKQLKAKTELSLSKLDQNDLKPTDINWFLDEIEQFCRHKALEYAIESSVDLIEKGNYGAVEKKVKDAVLIGLQKDLGLDFFNDPIGLINRLKDNNGMMTTGWKTLDDKLYGGFNRGELNIFAGAPGTGKSLFLQNLALNWAERGLNCIYLTLELSEELTGMRFNAMISGMTTKDVFKNAEDVGVKVKTSYKKNKWGKLHVKYMPIGSTTNDIKSYLKEYEIQEGIKPDAVLVDYLDLVHPNNKRVSPSDLFVKDKYVSEELRSMAQEWKILLATASQLNRQAMEEQDHEMYHIAGGVSKINTADNVMTIYTSEILKERGEYRLQFIKTRSSSGVGSKVFLAFDTDCLRIRDMEIGEKESKEKQDIGEIGDKLKLRRVASRKNETTGTPPTPAENIAQTGSDLRSLISKIND